MNVGIQSLVVLEVVGKKEHKQRNRKKGEKKREEKRVEF